MPLLASIGVSGRADAACTVTSGSVAVPDNGSTVTCPADDTSTAQIGDGTTDATVNLESNHDLDRTGALSQTGIFLNNATINLADGSVIQTNTNSANYGIRITNDATITMGANSRIQSKYAINVGNNATLTLESGAQLLGTDVIIGYGLLAGNQAIVTINANAQIISNNAAPIRGGTGAAGDFIDNSGLLQGNFNSMQLRAGDDFLTLRTGSNLQSTNGADGGLGTDTVTLYGTNTEDEIFLNFETLNMEGEDWSLTGTSAFTDVNVNSGTLSNNGTLATDVNVNSSGTYGGTGSTAGTVTNDGTVGPGNSIGTQTIIGAYNQTANGVLVIEYDGASADLLDITGIANLDGEVQFVPLVGSIPDGTAFTALQTSGGIAGDFATITGTTYLDPQVTTGANNVTVVINRLSYTTTSNSSTQTAVGSALDQAILADPVGMADVDVIFNSITEDEAADLLASQSGLAQTGAVLSGTQVLGANTGVAMTRLDGRPSPEMITATIGNNPGELSNIATAAGGDVSGRLPRTYWLQATGAFGHTEGDATSRGTSYNSHGFTLGVDTDALSDDTTFGIFVGYTKSDADVKGLNDDADTDIYQAGIYGGWHGPTLNIQGALSAAYLNYETARPTPGGTARADFSGTAIQATAEISRDFQRDGFVLSPLAGLSGSISRHDSYRETGAGVLNLNVGSDTIKQLSTALGVRVSRDVTIQNTGIGNTILHPSLDIAWTHEMLDNAPDISANFVGVPATAFSTSGPDRNRDALRVGFDISAHQQDSDRLSAYVSYGGNTSGDAVNHAFTAGVRLKW